MNIHPSIWRSNVSSTNVGTKLNKENISDYQSYAEMKSIIQQVEGQLFNLLHG